MIETIKAHHYWPRIQQSHLIPKDFYFWRRNLSMGEHILLPLHFFFCINYMSIFIIVIINTESHSSHFLNGHSRNSCEFMSFSFHPHHHHHHKSWAFDHNSDWPFHTEFSQYSAINFILLFFFESVLPQFTRKINCSEFEISVFRKSDKNPFRINFNLHEENPFRESSFNSNALHVFAFTYSAARLLACHRQQYNNKYLNL